MKRLAVGGIVLALMGLVTIMSYCQPASPQCGPHEDMLATLQGKYGEDVKYSELGYAEDTFLGLVEWTRNDATKTWSLLFTSEGQTCILLHDAEEKGPDL